jgi:transposase
VLRRWHNTGHSEARECRPGPRPWLSPTRLEKLVLQHPDATLAELGNRLQVSAATVCRALPRMDLPREKRSLHASKRDTPRLGRLRARWRRRRLGLDPRRLTFVDEGGVHLALTRL